MKSKLKKYLLIDNSNSRTKFLISVDGRVEGLPVVIPTAEISKELVFKLLGVNVFDGVVVSSVVPDSCRILERCFDCSVHNIGQHSAPMLKFDYPGLATLGADRIVNVLGAVVDGAVPSIVVDAGTAVTYDVVIERDGMPVYIGGAISPGLSAFTGYLHARTAQLPAVSLSAGARAIGKNTVEAIQSGALFGFCGMVQGIIHQITRELACEPQILLTGGDASLLNNVLEVKSRVEPLLIFKGLAEVAKHFF